MELDEVWAERIKKWHYEMHSAKIIFIPVISNMFLTLIGWYFVYDCETDPKDSRHNFITGSDIYDGSLNSVMCISLLAAMSFFMLLVATYNFKRLIQSWRAISCLSMMFVVFTEFLRDAFLKVGATEHIWIWTLLSAGIYNTFTLFADYDETMPALPCSIALGMLFHFGTLYVIQPFYYYIYNLFFLAFDY